MQKEQIKRLFIVLSSVFAICFLIIFLIVLLKKDIIHYVCPINHFFKIKCPGCGSTRAVMSYLRFDIIKALKLNYLFPLEFLYILFVVFTASKEYVLKGKYVYQNKHISIDVSVLIIVVAWTILRNVFNI